MSDIADPNPHKRKRIRQVLPDLQIGRHPPGRLNSLTDVPGVLVHTQSLNLPKTATHHEVNTGVTCIMPRRDIVDSGCYAGIFRFNGCGEMTGSHWIEETGILNSPVVLTNSYSVGAAYSGIYQYCIRHLATKDGPEKGLCNGFILPVVAETFDGYLSDAAAMAVTPEHVVRGLESVTADPVPEGNTGGGTGAVCQGFKGGTGSASRVVEGLVKGDKDGRPDKTVTFTIGALVQANYGTNRDFRIGAVPVGLLMMKDEKRRLQRTEQSTTHAAAPTSTQSSLPTFSTRAENEGVKDGSLIVVLATDAPLNPLQLQRIAKRATVGLSRTGGWGSNSSGDIFLAFSTGVSVPRDPAFSWKPTVGQNVPIIQDVTTNALFEAAADATEEAIYNALTCAEDMRGPAGRVVKALDLHLLQKIMNEHMF